MVEKGHGRIETRNCKGYNQIHLLEDLEKWSDLKVQNITKNNHKM